jgi:drug/metabolite transporter (DMT)-like permease
MHKVTGRWKLGLTLALIAAVFWGVLPIALKLALEGMDAYTITWYRFAIAGVVLAAILGISGGLPPVRTLKRRTWLLLVLALAGLTGNYVLYLLSLLHTTPAVAQVVIQLGPVFFLLGGVLVLKERFSRGQWIGFVALVAGLLLFFNMRLGQLLVVSEGTGLGVSLLVAAAIVWAVYGLAQKQLTRTFRPQQILLLIYVGAIVVLFPLAAPGSIRGLTGLQFWMLVFSSANTLIAYGAFAEALDHWEVSRVAAVLALAPLFTLTGTRLVNRFTPGLLPPEGLGILSVFGALLVVVGSIISALSAPGAPVPLGNRPVTS